MERDIRWDADRNKQEDVALMQAMKRGDGGALNTLVERWQRPVVNFVHRMLPDLEEAEDLAQSVLLDFWRSADRYEPAAPGFCSFIFTIARNLCLNQLASSRAASGGTIGCARLNGDDGEEMGRQYGEVDSRPLMQRRNVGSCLPKSMKPLPICLKNNGSPWRSAGKASSATMKSPR